MKTRAFTLVEILIVILIIVALSAILLPAFKQARVRAMMTTDLSSLRQIGMARQIYGGDFDESKLWRVADLVETNYLSKSLVVSPLDSTKLGIANEWLAGWPDKTFDPTNYRLSYISIGDEHVLKIIEQCHKDKAFGWVSSLANGSYRPAHSQGLGELSIIFNGSYLRLLDSGAVVWRVEPVRTTYGSLYPFVDERNLHPNWPWGD